LLQLPQECCRVRQTNQIGSEFRQSLVVALSPAVFDRHILALD